MMRESYDWMVSFSKDTELIGRKFRPSDLKYGAWPDGTIFVHVRTGQVREWRDRQAATVYRPCPSQETP